MIIARDFAGLICFDFGVAWSVRSPHQHIQSDISCMLSTFHRITIKHSIHSKNPSLIFKMPLVVPGMMGQGGGDDKNNSWMSKLAGKKLGESHNETVCREVVLPQANRVC